jgi:hypothetical protein
MTSGLRRALAALLAVPVVLMTSSTALAAPRSQQLASVVIANVGPGYSVLRQGPLDPEQFASSSPDPSAATGALHALSSSISSYERVWQDATMTNEVQDLVVHFDSEAAAQVFETSARHALSSGEIVSSGAVPTIAGALRTTYFATTATQVGVGQALTLRRGAYVVLLSIFSANTPTNPAAITPGDALTITQAQAAAVTKAATASSRARVSNPHRSLAGELLAAVAVICLFALWSRRTRPRPTSRRQPGPVDNDEADGS